MAAYYNEIDSYAAQWLRNLIAAGHIAPGDVDERSIVDVRADDLKGYTQCHFFAGIGGWSLALRLAGWADDRPVWTGSCPCQPLSSAGQRKGHADERHLWPAFLELIAERQPSMVFGEQVASADGREWFAAVRADLEGVGYACGAADLCAAGVGAPHIRQRLFWVANPTSIRWGSRQRPEASKQSHEVKRSERLCAVNQFWNCAEWLACSDKKTRPVEPGTFPLAHGISNRVGRLRAYGNAIVPQVAAAFIGAMTP
jgi:DNA (cytosine-5)-methyltransferase 1